MLNKNKALTNYIISLIFAYVLVVTFSILGLTENNFIGWGSGTSLGQVAGITFGISLILFLIIVTISTLPFANSETVKNSPLAIIMSALFMSALITFSVAILNLIGENIWHQNIADEKSPSVVLNWIMLIIFTPSIMLLMAFAQESTTKLAMISISENRAVEWEYSNFLKLSINRISVEHKENYTLFKHKTKTTYVAFVADGTIERRLEVSGATKSQMVANLEKVSNGNPASVVYLSNELPSLIGENEMISVIKGSEIFKFVMLDKKKK